MENGIRLGLPASEASSWKTFGDFERIDASDAERLDEFAHARVHFARAEMPEFNRQPAAKLAKNIDAHPGVGEIAHAAATNDYASAGKFGGRRRNVYDELF